MNIKPLKNGEAMTESYICKDCGERKDEEPCEHCAVYDEVTGEE